ncbi:MAG: PDDEXK nuclease domain-containing protein [Agriterribacter sp.]
MKNTLKEYRQWLVELKKNINQSTLQTSLKVNQNMLVLYWYIGRQIVQKIDKEKWGAKIITQLSIDLQKGFPDLLGFSMRNLLYMKQFAEAYPEFLITQQLAAQLKQSNKKAEKKQVANKVKLNKNNNSVSTISAENLITQQAAAQFNNMQWFFSNEELASIPWGHHIYLLDKITDVTERSWYIRKTIENNWSRAVLRYQIDTDLYQRQVKAKKSTNFHLTLPKAQSDLANQILKDPYKFGFLQMGEEITEFELELQIIRHIEEFLIELGAGFAFVGRQVALRVGRKNRKIDLLFYHLLLRSFIVIDLKMDEFEWEDTGQMNGYLNVINKKFRQSTDNPTIGIILCGAKDNIDVDYALQNINHPIGVSEYQYIKSLPALLKEKLPTPKQLKDEVKKIVNKRIKQ